MVKKSFTLAVVAFLLQLFFVSDGRTQEHETSDPDFQRAYFRLNYRHPEGADINYRLEVKGKGQTTRLDITRHINSNECSTFDITTSLSNVQVIRGGIATLLHNLNGPVCRTIMNQYGVVSDVQPLSFSKELFDSMNLTLQRDIMSHLGISSFPKRDLTVGSSWTKSGSKGTTETTFTYTIVEDGVSEAGYDSVVKIKIESDFTINEEKEIVDAKKSSYIKGKVSISGMLYFDLDAGRIVRLDQNIIHHSLHVMVDFNGTATISPSEDTVTTKLMIQ